MDKRPFTLMELAQDTVLKCKQGAPAIAEYLNKGASTLYNELNPNPADNRTHKLGLLDWLQILRLTGDYRSLHKVCGELGHVAVPVPEGKMHKSDWLRMQAADAKEHGEAAAALLTALSEIEPRRQGIDRRRKAPMRPGILRGCAGRPDHLAGPAR